jgi:hypothetical protein
MHEYLNYFTEIEERFCRRRGTVVLCSTLDWALMETWKDAGIPLVAVLRGIDATFDRFDARPSKTRKINSLAWCAQEVLAAAEQMQDAAVGAHRDAGEQKNKGNAQSGLELASIAAFLDRNAKGLEELIPPLGRHSSGINANVPDSAASVIRNAIAILRDLATSLKATQIAPLEDLERRLTVLEERIIAALLAATANEGLVALRAEADRELAPYRRKMIAAQIDHLNRQFVNKRLLEKYRIPRLSLFYMT